MTKKVCFILWMIVSFTGCQPKEKLAEIDFNDVIELKEVKNVGGEGINICVGSMITPKEGYAYYRGLLNYIGKHLKIKVNFIEKESYAEINNLLAEGKIDLAFVCGGPYIEGHDKFGLELLCAPQIDGGTVYYSYIIVHKDSHINKFEELRGKVFVFVDPMSNTGKIYPTYLLKTIGETPETFFKEYIYSYAHDTSIRAVAEGIVDAGAVDSLIWNYMDRSGLQFTRDTKIIKISPAYGIPPVVVRPGLKKDLKEKIKEILLNMHQDKEGREILEKMSIDKFVEIDDSNYNSIREIKKYIGE
ncbi:MAG: phosphate/phosphite/phosphonate ABC transporter substrate-binding protein [Candidatus Omnitrophica bacterium]|nr:phosphate/phosphite/phosphonate ABC transporter substrate-binding protein [Candidatus Omnitrophota bacterium]